MASTPVFLIEPDGERRSRLLHVLGGTPGEDALRAVASVQDVPPQAGDVPVSIIGLDAPSPVQEARALATQHGCRFVIFVGTREERERWSRALMYEAMLPPEREILALDEPDAIAQTLHRVRAAERAREDTRPAVERLQTDVEALRETVESTILDALAAPGSLRDAYAAVVRGSLERVREATPEQVPTEARRAVQSALRRIELLRGSEARDRVARSLRDVLQDTDEQEMVVTELPWDRFEDPEAARGWLLRACEDATLEPEATNATVAALELVGGTWPRATGHTLQARYVPGGGRIAFTWRDGLNGLFQLVMESPDGAESGA